MWQGIAPVQIGDAPVIYEGDPPVLASVFNAGPGTVRVEGWDERRPKREHESAIAIVLKPGRISSLRARLARCRLDDGEFAAVAWRMEA